MGNKLFVINKTLDEQFVTEIWEYMDTDTPAGMTPRPCTPIPRSKQHRVGPKGHKAFSFSKFEKRAEISERYGSGFKLQIGDCENFGLDKIRNHIGIVITKEAGKLKTTFISRAEYDRQQSSSIPFWDLKKKRKERIRKIKSIYKDYIVDRDVQTQTSKDNGKVVLGASEGVRAKMELGESSNQVDLASPSDLSMELMRSGLAQVSKPESTEASKEQLVTGIIGDDILSRIPQEVLDKIVEKVREQMREDEPAELQRQSISIWRNLEE